MGLLVAQTQLTICIITTVTIHNFLISVTCMMMMNWWWWWWLQWCIQRHEEEKEEEEGEEERRSFLVLEAFRPNAYNIGKVVTYGTSEVVFLPIYQFLPLFWLKSKPINLWASFSFFFWIFGILQLIDWIYLFLTWFSTWSRYSNQKSEDNRYEC